MALAFAACSPSANNTELRTAQSVYLIRSGGRAISSSSCTDTQTVDYGDGHVLWNGTCTINNTVYQIGSFYTYGTQDKVVIAHNGNSYGQYMFYKTGSDWQYSDKQCYSNGLC